MDSNGMTTEIQMLAWAIVLGLLHVVLTVVLATFDKGLKWNLGARDSEGPPASAIAARINRGLRNFLETFPFFAAAVLAVVVTGRADAISALGAQLYFWARLVYVPVYAAGVPLLRTLVWTVSIAGLVMVLTGLFRG